MSTFKERLVLEQEELSVKIDKLEAFLKDTAASSKIDPMQLDLLRIQLPTMMTYHKILKMRTALIVEVEDNIKHPDLMRAAEETPKTED